MHREEEAKVRSVVEEVNVAHELSNYSPRQEKHFLFFRKPLPQVSLCSCLSSLDDVLHDIRKLALSPLMQLA